MTCTNNVDAELRRAIDQYSNRVAASLDASASCRRWESAREKEKTVRCAYTEIAIGYAARQRGAPADDNPHEPGFFQRHWGRGWSLADAGKPVRFTVVKEPRA